MGGACAEQLADQGAELILCDKDASRLDEAASKLGATGLFCDVASEASVNSVADRLAEQHLLLDMVINAAGGGYERTLGMYRVSRALLPALSRARQPMLVNIPPSSDVADAAVFPYASSGFAFHRLSAALAFEARGTPVSVLIGCPASGTLTQVLPNPNAGSWADSCRIRQASPAGLRTLVGQIAALMEDEESAHRRAS